MTAIVTELTRGRDWTGSHDTESILLMSSRNDLHQFNVRITHELVITHACEPVYQAITFHIQLLVYM